MKYLYLIINLSACGPYFAPPEEISLDPNFTLRQKEVIRDSIDAWCDAVDWCPEEVSWLEPITAGRFIVDTYNFSRFGYGDKVAAVNTGNYIYFDPGHWTFKDLRTLWLISSHEIGHWGIGSKHLADGSIMEEPMKNMDTRPLELDCVSVETWKQVQQ